MRNLVLPTALCSALALMYGCSKPDINVTDSSGNKVKVSADGTSVTSTDSSGKTTILNTDAKSGAMTMKDEKGSTTVETGKSVSEADLGLPFYPGSAEKVGASFKADTPQESSAMSVRTTPDDPAKVAEFYKSKLKDASTMSMNDATNDRQMVTGQAENGAKATVTATREKGKGETEINATTVLSKKK